MTNQKRKDTEANCTADPYDPWERHPPDLPRGDEGGVGAETPPVLSIGTFPDELPRLRLAKIE